MNREPKRYKYSIIHNGNSQELVADPKGWEQQAIGFERDDNFGINSQFTVPLEFAKDGYDKHISIFDATGFSSDANLNILKRLNDWTYEQFYLCTFDYTTAKYDRDIFTVEAHENGIYKKLEARKSQEYEIDLPTSHKTIVDFTGVSTLRNNILQAFISNPYSGEDKLRAKNASETVYAIYGNRTVREYTDNLLFTNPENSPFPYFVLKAAKSVELSLLLTLNLTVSTAGTLPNQGEVWLARFTSTGESGAYWNNTTPIKKYYPTRIKNAVFGNVEFYEYQTETISTSLSKDEYLGLIYFNNTNDDGSIFTNLNNVTISNASDTKMAITDLSNSSFSHLELEGVTHEWLIDKLCEKILDGHTYNLSFDYTDLNYVPILVPNSSIRQLDDKKIICKLDDVLKSLYILANIGVKIWGENILICDQDDCYPTDRTPTELTVFKGTEISVDTKHLYNSVEVGWNPESNDKENGLFEVLAKNNFQIINNNVDDKKLSLVHPYIGSPYSIENYIRETRNSDSVDNKSDNRITIFACKEISSGSDASFNVLTQPLLEDVDIGNRASCRLYFPFSDNSLIREETGSQNISVLDGLVSSYFTLVYAKKTCLITLTGTITVTVDWTLDDMNTDYITGRLFGDGNFNKEFNASVSGKRATLTCVLDESFYLDENRGFGIYQTINVPPSNDTFTITEQVNTLTIGATENILQNATYELYREQTIINGQFDWATMYNLPMSPKRILNKHLPYISVSTWRNINDIEFTSAERDANVTTKMDYEETAITEDDDVIPTTPVFLPVTIDVKTAISFDSLMDIVGENSYTPFKIVDRDLGTIQGWTNKIAFKVGKEEEQQFELQAKTI